MIIHAAMPRSSHAGAIGTQAILAAGRGGGRTTRLVPGSLGPLGHVPAGWRLKRTTTRPMRLSVISKNGTQKWIPHGTRRPASLLCRVLMVLDFPGAA